MKYDCKEEIIGSPAVKLDGDVQDDDTVRAAGIISDFTGISSSKVIYFLEKVGLGTILNKPSIMCSCPDEIKKLMELKEIVIGVGNCGSDTDRPI